MKIYAVCHGQTDLNTQGLVQGRKSDLPLNKIGKEQACKIAETLSLKGIDLIVTSPLKCAMETTDIIANHLNIKKDKIVKGLRLYERDFGDYERLLISEVDINVLQSWTDNAPTPNGETIREFASRVFGFLDEGLAKFKEIIERERRDILYKKYEEKRDWSEPYDADAARKAIEKAMNLAPQAMKELPKIKILFVVHSHVLHAMHWYFNGLPEEGSETVIETENSGFYEFDTDNIPQRMRDYQIILDRRLLEDRLKRLSKSPYKASYTTCFAMCYMPGDFEITYEDYICPVCRKKTRHNRERIRDLSNAKEAVYEITKARLKVDAVIDEREYCRRCFGKKANYPSPILKIRFSPEEKYHEERTGSYYDYKCLTTFIKGKDEYQGKSESMSLSDMHHPLVDCIDQIVRMTGLCPEIVEEWKDRIAKIAAQNAKGSLTKKETLNMKGNVEIPLGYTKIDDEAFKDRKGITSITIPESVTSIGKEAFEWCGLTSISIPESVTFIGKRAFMYSSLISITLPEKITSIAKETFKSCYYLKNIALHNGITKIGEKAFESCFKLKNISIHDGITEIGEGAFESCINLTAIDVSEKNPKYSSLDGVLFDKEQKTLICYPAGIERDAYTVPDGVTTISKSAFKKCRHLKNVVLPDSITSIGDTAFGYCENLTKVNIHAGVKNIANWVFSGCKNLIEVNLPDSVAGIGHHAFSECEKLKSITIPDSVESIDREAFKNCTNLASIIFPANIEAIGSNAFERTAWLEAQADGVVYIGTIAYAYKGDKTKLSSLVFREGTRGICSSVFEKCTNLTDIVFPDNLEYIGAFAFHETAWFEAQPDGVVYIGNIAHTYKGDRNHTSLTLRDDTKKIGEYAFCHGDKLESIKIPDGVTHIGKYAFWNCKQLKEITIPDSVAFIGEEAFGRCEKLQESVRTKIEKFNTNE